MQINGKTIPLEHNSAKKYIRLQSDTSECVWTQLIFKRFHFLRLQRCFKGSCCKLFAHTATKSISKSLRYSTKNGYESGWKKNGFMVTSQAGDVAFEEERIILRRKTRRGTGGWNFGRSVAGKKMRKEGFGCRGITPEMCWVGDRNSKRHREDPDRQADSGASSSSAKKKIRSRETSWCSVWYVATQSLLIKRNVGCYSWRIYFCQHR